MSLRPLIAFVGPTALSVLLAAAAAININPTIYKTLSLLEAVWLLENLVGFIYTRRNYKDSTAEYKKVLSVKGADPVEVIVARNSRRIDAIVLTKQLIYLGVGVLWAVTDQPLRVQNQGLGVVTVVLVFIIGSGLLSYLSYSTRHDREDAQEAWGRLHAKTKMLARRAERNNRTVYQLERKIRKLQHGNGEAEENDRDVVS